MVQAAQARNGRQLASAGFLLYWPSVWRILAERIVHAISVVILHVLSNQSAEMLLIQGDDMVQDLAPATAHPPLRQTILPGRLNAGALRLQTRRLQKCDHLVVELGVSIQDDVAIWRCFRECFAQLLHNPSCSRMSGNVEVQDAAPSVLDDEEV